MSVTVGQLLPKWQKLIALKDTDTVEEAIETLRDNHLGSVPVRDASGKWLGYVGALDLLAGLVRSIKKDGNAKLPSTEEKSEAAEFEAFFHEANFRLKPLREANVVDLSERNPFVTLPGSVSLDEAVGLIEKGIPRLAITEGLQVVGVLSQIDVVRFLDADAAKTLGPNATKSFAELNFLKPVKAVKVSTSMFSAIVAMEREGVRALAVVDNHWHLVAQLSPSDIMSVLPSVKFADLNRPLLDYLPRLHDLVWRDKPMVRLHESATLATGLRELIQHAVHQLWVTNQAGVPIGIVTLTDILQVFMRHLDAISLAKALTPKDAAVVAKQAEARHKHDALEQRRAEWRHGTLSRKHLSDHAPHEPHIYLGPVDPKPASVVELS